VYTLLTDNTFDELLEKMNHSVSMIYCSINFYAWKQLLFSAHLSHHNSVCPSVHLSHGWISQKRCKL